MLENEQSWFPNISVTYVTAHSPTLPSLCLRHSSFFNRSVASPRHNSFSTLSFASPTSQALHLRHLVSCSCYEYGSILLCARTRKVFTTLPIPAVAFKETTTNFPSLHLRHNSFSNPSVALPTSQLILQPYRCFTYVTVHSPTLVSLLCHLQLILQPFRLFTNVTAHSQTLPSLYLCRSSFSNRSVASPTSQLILQPFFRFYVIGSSPTSPGEPSLLRILFYPSLCSHKEIIYDPSYTCSGIQENNKFFLTPLLPSNIFAGRFS